MSLLDTVVMVAPGRSGEGSPSALGSLVAAASTQLLGPGYPSGDEEANGQVSVQHTGSWGRDGAGMHKAAL